MAKVKVTEVKDDLHTYLKRHLPDGLVIEKDQKTDGTGLSFRIVRKSGNVVFAWFNERNPNKIKISKGLGIYRWADRLISLLKRYERYRRDGTEIEIEVQEHRPS